MPRGSWIAVWLVCGLLAAPADARDFDCTSNLGRIELPGNLNVAGRCRLSGTEVKGNITLFAGGSLVAREARIHGNVDARRADFVDIDKTVIAGNVRLEELVGDSSTIQRSRIRGNALLTKNRSSLEIVNNDFDGNFRASRNTGGVTISGNSFGGKLECTANKPPPVGLGNVVKRSDAKGQCRDLRPDETDTPPPSDPPPAASPPPPSSPPRPPSASPPSSEPPPTSSPPLAAPPSTPPPAAAPPTTSAPPAAPPPTDATPPAPEPADPVDPAALDDGGAGAFGWFELLLVPLLVWRRFRRSRSRF